MQSPDIFSKEAGDTQMDRDNNNTGVEQPMISQVPFRKIIRHDVLEHCYEAKIASLEEHVKQLLIELQMKRKEASLTNILENLETDLTDRERNALMRAETAEGRAQCATAAAYKLAEEREALNRIITEVKGKFDVLSKENDLLLVQIRKLLAESLTHERQMKETQAERASHEANKKMLRDKVEEMKKTVEEVNKWISGSEENMKQFSEEMQAMRALESKIKEEALKKDACIKNLIETLSEAAAAIANLTSKVGTLEANHSEHE